MSYMTCTILKHNPFLNRSLNGSKKYGSLRSKWKSVWQSCDSHFGRPLLMFKCLNHNKGSKSAAHPANKPWGTTDVSLPFLHDCFRYEKTCYVMLFFVVVAIHQISIQFNLCFCKTLLANVIVETLSPSVIMQLYYNKLRDERRCHP